MNKRVKTMTKARDPRHYAGVVGANVRRMRLMRGMTLQELSESLTEIGHPLDESSLSLLERGVGAVVTPRSHGGRVSVSVDRLVALADILGTTYVDLMTERP